jgi:hypothetical protein
LVKRLVLLSILVPSLWADLFDQVRAMLSPEAYASHRKLIALLFENPRAYCDEEGCDPVRIAATLRDNGLLDVSLPRREEVVLTMECAGEHPLFFMKAVEDTLQKMGLTGWLTKEARMDENGFGWSVTYRSGNVPDPVKMAERLKRMGVRVAEIERLEATHWRYRLDMGNAKLEALPLEAGETKKVVRPVRPVWLDVSRVDSLTIRELPGSHWYADVVVYDKMLHILSMKQNDTRTRYLRLRLPKEAAYVKIGDRFTLENIRSGLKLSAR